MVTPYSLPNCSDIFVKSSPLVPLTAYQTFRVMPAMGASVSGGSVSPAGAVAGGWVGACVAAGVVSLFT